MKLNPVIALSAQECFDCFVESPRLGYDSNHSVECGELEWEWEWEWKFVIYANIEWIAQANM